MTLKNIIQNTYSTIKKHKKQAILTGLAGLVALNMVACEPRDPNKPDLDDDYSKTDTEQVDDTQDYDNAVDDSTDETPDGDNIEPDDNKVDEDNLTPLEAELICEQDSTYLNTQNCYVDSNADDAECVYDGSVVDCDDFVVDNYTPNSELTATVNDLYDGRTTDAKTMAEGSYETATIGECNASAGIPGNYPTAICNNFGPKEYGVLSVIDSNVTGGWEIQQSTGTVYTSQVLPEDFSEKVYLKIRNTLDYEQNGIDEKDTNFIEKEIIFDN